jgi:hypothetical protein
MREDKRQARGILWASEIFADLWEWVGFINMWAGIRMSLGHSNVIMMADGIYEEEDWAKLDTKITKMHI